MGRIWVALVCALGLAAIIGGANALFRVKAVPKGWRAPYTMRAPSDLAWNQRETRAAEVRGFVPIYDQPPGLLEQRRRAILDEVDQLQVAYWRYPADGPEGGAELAPAVRAQRDETRLGEVRGLVEEVLDLVEPYYLDGVVADAEFPARQMQIRVFESDPGTMAPEERAGEPAGGLLGGGEREPAPAALAGGRYRRVEVARLHRFSELRTAAEQALERYFPGVEVSVRAQVVGYVLDRLPPNLRYARTNADHVADRSLITGEKAVLVRSGEVLVRRGQTIDTRAEDALRAALDARPTRRGAFLATLVLVLVVTLLGGQAMAAAGPTLARPRAQAITFASFGLLLVLARLLLALTPVSETSVPLAAVPAAVAWRTSARPAAVVALVGAAYAALGLAFDVTTFTVTFGGGLTLALVCRRGRWRWGLIAAAGAAVVQLALFGACVVLGARPRSVDSIFAGLQTLISGVLSGLGGMAAAALWQGWKAQRKRRAGAALESPQARATLSAR